MFKFDESDSHCKQWAHWALGSSSKATNFQMKNLILEECVGLLNIEIHFWEWLIIGALPKRQFLIGNFKMIKENIPEPFQMV